MPCLQVLDISKVHLPGVYSLMNSEHMARVDGTHTEGSNIHTEGSIFTFRFMTGVELACPQEERSLKRAGFPRAFLARSRR